MKKYLIFIVLLMSNQSNAGGPTGKAIIDKIAFQSEHLFLYSSNWGNPNECGKTDAVVLKRDSANFDKAYTLILAAFMAGKTISGYSDDCVTWDEKEYNTIRGHKYLVVEK